MNHVRRGEGTPLLLIHGLGSRWQTWEPILDGLAAEREVIAVDLPGFGGTPPLPEEVSIRTLADSLVSFLDDHDLQGVDVVGSSMGARLALELVRRGNVGATVALDPGGFWSDGQRRVFGASVGASIKLVRALQPAMPALTGNAVGRTALLAQFSARPWALPADVVLTEMRSFAGSPSVDAALQALVAGPAQEGSPKGSIEAPLVIGWGRRDRVTLPSQAATALKRFPDASLHWFERCGHFPHWDSPEETIELILDVTGKRPAHAGSNGAAAAS